ncbi:MAG TPA: class IV adenylate cyclase [Gemmatimonadaceae bacterium]|nr:class IV adenylate cyclase [Gemmatimonadaceae bacterium]
MIELELKAVIPDLDELLRALERAGARATFVGRLEDRRFDAAGDVLGRKGETLRVRIYRPVSGAATASVDWKGPVSVTPGYKQREELSVALADPDVLMTILGKIGLQPVQSIDRYIRQFALCGASVRLEHYPLMDDLVEVEGDPVAIERAIERIGIPRASFTSESLNEFVRRFEARTKTPAVLAASPGGSPGGEPEGPAGEAKAGCHEP